MTVIVHGVPGGSLTATGRAKYGPDARRGAYFERRVGAALEQWLTGRPDELHLFHDLTNFNNVQDFSGSNLPPMSVGEMNIDHLVLSGATWLQVDAKGCAAGRLRFVDRRGVLERADGAQQPQPWMDKRQARIKQAALYRLTGVDGPRRAAWVLPDETTYEWETVQHAPFIWHGGMVLSLADVIAGDLDDLLPIGQPPAESAVVARVMSHLSTQTA